MAERNELRNGRFTHNLDSWTAASAIYSAGDGDEHYGVAVLSTGGGYISQTFAIPRIRVYSIHASVKAIGADLSGDQCQIVIEDGDGNTVKEIDLDGTADTWTENDETIGLASGTTFTIKIINNSASGDVRIDDVWLYYVPMSRADIAARVEEKIGRLSDDRSLSTTASGTKTEGDFTYAIDAALRSVGAINPETGLPDVRYLNEETLQSALDYAESEMIEQLQRDYATEVDVQVGQRRESLSQIAKALGEIKSGKSGSPGRVVMRRITHAGSRDFKPHG